MGDEQHGRTGAVHPVHTYSIVARDPQTGQLGVAVQSHYFSVGSIVTWAEPGVGAVATQSFVRIDYGPEGLALMKQGYPADRALQELLAKDEQREVRQVAMVDSHGNVAVHTGSKCIAAAGHLVGEQFSVQANLMVDDAVWPAMKQAYEQAQGDLADRLMAALDAGQAAGGDIRGQQSAAILVVSGERTDRPWAGRLFDLRVEDHPRPVEELKRLVRLRRAYMLNDLSDELMAEGRFDEAAQAMSKAIALAPDIVEMQFWAAVGLFTAGREEQALSLFREVFAKEPVWVDLVPRLVPSGLLPDDPTALKRITDQYPRTDHP
jgi:uncharacterized Ntn-hydrolase superfamily protein